MKKRIKAADIVSYVIVAVMCLIFLFPFVYIVSRSLMGDVESYSATGALFPERITFEAYRTVLDADLLKYFKNTLIVLVLNCVGIPFSAALCAYGFSKIKFHGSDVVFSVVLATMMLPSIVIQIPLYAIYYNMKWLGTLLPLIVPGFFGGGAVIHCHRRHAVYTLKFQYKVLIYKFRRDVQILCIGIIVAAPACQQKPCKPRLGIARGVEHGVMRQGHIKIAAIGAAEMPAGVKIQSLHCQFTFT